MPFIAKDISTNKVIENTIEDIIESIKYLNHLKRNPPIIEVSIMQRMKLDSNDPDFISYANYTRLEDDEYEEGDDKYRPR